MKRTCHSFRFGIFLICLMLFGVNGMAQTFNEYWLIGEVKDAITGEPLEGASVLQVGMGKGVIAEAEGKFMLKAFGKAPVIRISYLGYEPLILRPKADEYNDLQIRLEPSDVRIEGIEITEKQIELAYPDWQTHIVDYGFWGTDGLLMIIYDTQKRKKKLVLVDDQDEILDEHFGPGEQPSELVKDCYGNYHYLTKNYACQIFIEGGRIMATQDTRETFEQVVSPCAGVINNSYFLHYRKDDQHEYYEWVDGTSLSRKLLTVVADSFALAQIRDDQVMQQKGLGTNAPGMSAARDKFQAALDSRFKKEITYKPTFGPLHIIKGTACVFDHENGNIRIFNEFGSQIREIPISYQRERHWKEFIIVDEEEQNAYTLLEKGGIFTLKQIDLETGELTGGWELDLPFITEISIRDDVAYFLYKETDYDPTKRLYKLELDY